MSFLICHSCSGTNSYHHRWCADADRAWRAELCHSAFATTFYGLRLPDGFAFLKDDLVQKVIPLL